MKRKPQMSVELSSYLKIGSEERLKRLTTKLELNEQRIKEEEETMAALAEAFLKSSERHNHLSNTQRSLKAMIFNHTKETMHE